MNFLQNIVRNKALLLKYTAIALGALVVAVLFLNVAGVDIREGTRSISVSPDMGAVSEEYGYGDDSSYKVGYTTPSIGIMPPVYGGYVSGDDAESLEVTEYHTFFEVGSREETCTAVAELKSREDVVFVSANEYEEGCTYTFKVAKDAVADTLAYLESLNPRDVSENTYTIRQIVSDYETQIDVLKTKLLSLEDAQAQATAAYDAAISAATRAQDLETLARIIDSKLAMMERLTMERLSTSAQLGEMERAKADQLDRITYTYFTVSVYEKPVVDGQEIMDSWTQALRDSVADINAIAQQLSVGLIALILLLVQYALYFVVLLFVAKYGWKFAQSVWKK